MPTTNTNTRASTADTPNPTTDPGRAPTRRAAATPRPPTPVPFTPEPPPPLPPRRRLIDLDRLTAMDLHNNTIDEKGVIQRMRWRVIQVVGRATDRPTWIAMRECVKISIRETDLPFYRLEQLFYMVALDHINDLIRADEAWHANDTAAAMINNIPRTYDRL